MMTLNSFDKWKSIQYLILGDFSILFSIMSPRLIHVIEYERTLSFPRLKSYPILLRPTFHFSSQSLEDIKILYRVSESAKLLITNHGSKGE